MFKFNKKLITVDEIQKEVDTYECWSVEWISHTGDYYAYRRNCKEFFTKEDDANIFHKNIVDAGKLLRYNALTVYPVKKEN
jgi:hypothetical protein